MAIALRASSAASSTGTIFSTGSATLTLGTTAQIGDVVPVAFTVSSNRSVSSIQTNNSESLGQLVTVQNAGAFLTTWVYRVRLTQTCTSVTVTLDGTVASDSAMWGAAFTGMSSGTLDGATATATQNGATVFTCGNVTTTVADALLIACLGGDNSRTVSVADADYTSAVAYAGTGFCAVIDYRICSATETNNHSVTMSASMNGAHVLGVLNGVPPSDTGLAWITA